MSEHDNLISQIRRKEDEVANMIRLAEESNDQRIASANESAIQFVLGIEESAKKAGKIKFQQSKEKGKEEYKAILVEYDNERRDEVEGGKTRIPQAKKLVHDEFLRMFEIGVS